MMFLKQDGMRWCLAGLVMAIVLALAWILDPSGEYELTLAAYITCVILVVVAFTLAWLVLLARPPVKKMGLLSLLAVFLGCHAANLVFWDDYITISEHIRKRRDNSDHLGMVVKSRIDEPNTYPRSYYHVADIQDQKVMVFSSGPSNSPIIFCNEGGYWASFKTDRYGFNNPDQEWDKDVRLAILGDSFTLGECVDQQDTWPSVVRDVYPGTVNVSASGLGPISMLALLREYVKDEKPSLVIWAYYAGNDLQEMYVEENDDVMSRYLREDGFVYHLKDMQKEIDHHLKENFSQALEKHSSSPRTTPLRKRAIDHIKTILFLRALRWKYDFQIKEPKYMNDIVFEASNEEFDIPTQSQKLVSIAKRMKEEVAEWGGEFVILYLTYYKSNFLGQVINIDKADFIIDELRSVDIHVMDTRDIFMESKDIRLYYPLGDLYSHLNERGYRAIGERVLDYIQSHPDLEKLLLQGDELSEPIHSSN